MNNFCCITFFSKVFTKSIIVAVQSIYLQSIVGRELLNLKQICHFKIKRLSPGDFKMLIKENGRGNVLSHFFFFQFYCLSCPCKVKQLTHIALLLNIWEHTGLYEIFCSENSSMLPLESRNHSRASTWTLVSCGRNGGKKIKIQIPSLFTVTPL